VEDIEMDTLGNLWIITQSKGITVYKNGGVTGFDCIDLSLQTCATTSVIENNLSSNLSITVFPNPFTNTITFTLNNNWPSEIILYDINSRKLLKQEFTSAVSINTEQLAKGIYLYEVRNKNGVIKKGKVVKE
jgi:hypothetical protein